LSTAVIAQRVGRVVRASPGKRWARVYEIIARGTIEEALSRARHFGDVVEEVACRAVPDSELDALLGRIAARVRSSAASRL
jgi:superfamily II DNA or RNA helicase